MSVARRLGTGAVALALVAGVAAAPPGVPARAASSTDPAQLVVNGESWPEYTIRKLQYDAFYAGATGTLSPTYTAARGEQNSRSDLATGATDVAAVSEPLTQAEQGTATQNGITPAYVPYGLGAVGVIAAVKTSPQHGSTMITGLHLTLATLAKIFAHQITRWFDPEIRDENSEPVKTELLYTADASIQTVVRRDSSATNRALVSAFLADPNARPIWEAYATSEGIPPDVAPEQWPSDTSAMGVTSGSAGVIQTVMNLDVYGKPVVGGPAFHSIGYVGPAWAADFAAPLVGVADEEPTPQFVLPTSPSIVSAFASPGVAFDQSSDLYSIDYAKLAGAGAYPIPLAGYFGFPMTGGDPAKTTPTADFLKFVLSGPGQDDVNATGMVAPPADVLAAGQKIADALAATAATTTTTTTTPTTSTPPTSSTSGPTNASSTATTSVQVLAASSSNRAGPSGRTGGSSSGGSSAGGSSAGGDSGASSTLPFTGGPVPWMPAVLGLGLIGGARLDRRRARRAGRGSG